ncbi:TetR/AcrR family transcriptional regulator [Nocardia sp. JW2]|uniref:TetR/AcrR family transcriptional regulator n=1 Tax=Nocardia sp. JW2 TaxID=3450738 RepID=UPI003F4437CE
MSERVQRFLDAALAIIGENGSTDFTVQEVVERSHQSLRTFYLQFDGKNALLLALLENALGRAADRIRAAVAAEPDPLGRLAVAVRLLFALCRDDPGGRDPLFTDFAPRLLVTHPAHVEAAHAPLLGLFVELVGDAAAAGALRPGLNPRRIAAITMQTVMFTAQADGADESSLTPEEVWEFCTSGVSTIARM